PAPAGPGRPGSGENGKWTWTFPVGRAPRDRGVLSSADSDVRRAPVVRAGGTGHLVGPDDLAVGEVDVFQMGEVCLAGVLAVGHARLHVDDHGVFQLDGEVVLLGAGGRGAIPLQAALVQAFAGGQGVEEQRRGLVEHLGDHQRLVHPLAGRLAGLRVAGNDHLMAEGLDQDLILMTFLEDVADRVLAEGAGGDQALLAALDGQVGGSWHGYAPCKGEWVCPGSLTRSVPKPEIPAISMTWVWGAASLGVASRETAQGPAQPVANPCAAGPQPRPGGGCGGCPRRFCGCAVQEDAHPRPRPGRSLRPGPRRAAR